MSQNDLHFHYVSTHQEARDLIEQRDQFWITNCGCREDHGSRCRRSRLDVCLQFSDTSAAHGTGKRMASKAEAMELLLEAKDKHLVARPFHKENDFTVTDGICFCCDDCCWYFLKSEEKCDKGAFLEKTDMSVCNHCGICEDICYFGARKMVNGEITIDRLACYGCGLCAEICPEECVVMVSRN
jgi:Pyruvate/2-oxoacid:ferredoxin oxidoreductase delta subunit